MFRVPDSLNLISSIFVYICEIKGVFFAMTNNSSVLLYLFRAQISSYLLGIIYGKKTRTYIQFDDRITFEVMPSGADGELPQTNGKLIIRNKTSSCLS
jgi:hypothetical protein